MTRAALVLWVLFAASSAQAAVRSLLAIGNDVGLDDEQPLRWAETDAARLRDVWVELGGVTPARATLLEGQTVADVTAELLRLRGQIEEVKRRGERAELFVTFSGHGDDDALHLAGERLPMRKLDALLASIPADAIVVVVDACRTGAVRSGANRGASRGPAFDVTLVKDPAPRGRVLLASASRGEVAQESDDIEGAWFTHHVTAGLRGAADSDGNGEVTLDELYRHAWARTVSQSFGGVAVQHPQITIDLRGEGELSLTRLDRAAATLTLQPGLSGSFLVVDDRRGDVLFEVEKAAGAPLSLAVPPRRLRIQQRLGATQRIAGADVARGSRVVVADEDFVVVNRVAARARGGDVDPSPWGVFGGLAVGTAPAAARWTTGALLSAQRRLFDSAGFIDVGVLVGTGAGDDALRTWREREARLWLGASLEQWTPVGRVVVGAGPSLHVATQTITRKDADRLREAGLDIAATSSRWALGPGGVVTGGFFIPLFGPLQVGATVVGHAGAEVRDGSLDGVAGFAVACGLGGEL
jgi:hypothetical protein